MVIQTVGLLSTSDYKVTIKTAKLNKDRPTMSHLKFFIFVTEPSV